MCDRDFITRAEKEYLEKYTHTLETLPNKVCLDYMEIAAVFKDKFRLVLAVKFVALPVAAYLTLTPDPPELFRYLLSELENQLPSLARP